MNKDFEKARLPALDGIRGFAAALVLFGHTSAPLGESLLTPAIVAAKSGVYLFFVLSAFLLTKQFLTVRSAIANTPVFLSEYFFRRCTRILPLYWFAVLVHYGIQYVVPGKQCVIFDARAVFKSLLMNEGYGHFWTIPIEFIFYFILPGIALFAAGAKRKETVLVAYVGFILLSITLLSSSQDHGVAAAAFVFVAGSALAVVDVYFYRDCGPILRHVLGVAGAVAVVLFFASRPILENRGLSHAEIENLRPFWTAVASTLLAATLWGSAWVGRLFSSWPLRFLGAISFSVYVWHIFVYAAIQNLGGRLPAEFRHLLAWSVAVTVGVASHRWLEMSIYRSPRARAYWARAVDCWIPSMQQDGHGQARAAT